MVGKIYIIKNDINDKVYIGATTQSLEKRFSEHISHSKNPNKRHLFQKAILNLGKSHFWIELLEDNVPKEKLSEREIFFIKKFNSFYNGYNQTKGGNGSLFQEEEIIKLIYNEYKKGKSANQIAIFFECSVDTILKILRKQKITIFSTQRKHEVFNEEILKQMWNIDKKPLKEIATFFNVDSSTIKRWKRKLCLEKRDSGTVKRNQK